MTARKVKQTILFTILFPGSRQTTSTPELENSIENTEPGKVDDEIVKEASDNIHADNNNVIEAAPEYKVVTNGDITAGDDQEGQKVRRLQAQSSISKVEAYVNTLPSPRVSPGWRRPSDDDERLPYTRHHNTVLDDSFDSEASSMSRSRLSSRQSDLLTSNNRGCQPTITKFHSARRRPLLGPSPC